ncbi:MAG TPA: hypothetical protein VMS11_04170 [Solirubrobacterales bacterium]|nr:hypothetical protein [Solirubrobacterales bacterium]
MLCALLVSAFAAQSASAVTKGTTGFTCKVPAEGDKAVGEAFSDAHCTKSSPSGTFRHVEVPENTLFEGFTTNEGTQNETKEASALFLKATVATIPIKLKATGAFGEGVGQQTKDPTTGEHYGFGEGKTTYTGVTVVEPANCKVVQGAKTGEVETTQLVGTGKGQEMAGRLEPKAGANTAFAEFEIANNGGVCAAAQKVKIVGSIKGTPNGATIEYTHEGTTAQGTLRFGSIVGPKVGVELKTTGKGRIKGSEGPYFPGGATTIETP